MLVKSEWEKKFLPLQFVSSSSEQIGGRDGTDPLLAVWKIRKIGNCKCLPDVEKRARKLNTVRKISVTKLAFIGDQLPSDFIGGVQRQMCIRPS